MKKTVKFLIAFIAIAVFWIVGIFILSGTVNLIIGGQLGTYYELFMIGFCSSPFVSVMFVFIHWADIKDF
jgi:hypothetical protein